VSGPRTSTDPEPGRARGREPGEPGDPPRHIALKRATLAAATAFLSVNVWTGAPLFALWVGSQASDDTVLSMKAVIVVVVVLSVLVLALAVAITWVSNTYDELTGRPQSERRASWMRSMRSESEGHISSRVGESAPERIVMISVYVAVISFLVWFLLFSHYTGP
jgi:hypothetical protein